MWSHYAKGHRGICLIFNAREQVIGDAYAVRYSNEYPVIAIPDDPGHEFLIKAVLTKPAEWQYEQEYRIVAREERLDDYTDWEPKAQHGFVNLSPNALAGVILGAFMSSSEEAWARGLLASASRPVEVWRAHLKKQSYALSIDREG